MRKAIEHLRGADPVMNGIIERVGRYQPSYIEPVFGSLVRSIVFQQLSGRVASVIHARLLSAAGEPLKPSAILALTPDQLRAIGLSRQKAAYIRDLAEKAREIGFRRLPRLTDEEVIERLTAVTGIGVWTAHMFLIFALRRPDILPSLDLGVRAAIRREYGLQDLPSMREVERIGAPWRPYRSIATWYLWRSTEIPGPEPEP